MNALITSVNRPRLITTAIFGALALSCGAASIAADRTDLPQIVVKFGDLNLSNPQGAAVLYGRIRAASRVVCGRFDDRELAAKMRLDACVRKAISDAVTKVGQPELFAIYNAKNHEHLPITVAIAQTR